MSDLTMTTARDVIAARVAEFMSDASVQDGHHEDCAKDIIGDLLSAPDSVHQELAALLNPWHPVGPPRDTWLRTKREGEDGENVCMLPSFNGDEWFERDGGRTTVTHHSFAAPTHWALPVPPSEDKT